MPKVRPTYFTVRDDDINKNITLSLDPSSLKNQDGEMTIEMTATLDSKPASKNLTFSFKDVDDYPGPDRSDVDPEILIRGELGRLANGFRALAEDDRILSRDTFYDARGFGNLVIDEKARSKTVKIYIDPENKTLRGRSWIAIGSDESPADLPKDGGVEGIGVIPGFIQVTADPVPLVAGLRAISPPIREDIEGVQPLLVEVELKDCRPR